MTWWEERNARWEKERKERVEALRSQGFKLIACVAYDDTRTGEHSMCTWLGETETLVLLNPPEGYSQHGMSCILVGPESEVVSVVPGDAHKFARERGGGVILTVFKGTRPS